MTTTNTAQLSFLASAPTLGPSADALSAAADRLLDLERAHGGDLDAAMAALEPEHLAALRYKGPYLHEDGTRYEVAAGRDLRVGDVVRIFGQWRRITEIAPHTGACRELFRGVLVMAPPCPMSLDPAASFERAL